MSVNPFVLNNIMVLLAGWGAEFQGNYAKLLFLMLLIYLKDHLRGRRSASSFLCYYEFTILGSVFRHF